MAREQIKIDRTNQNSKRITNSSGKPERKKLVSRHYQNVPEILYFRQDQKNCEVDIIILLLSRNKAKSINLESERNQVNLWQNISITFAGILVSLAFAILFLVLSLLMR